MASTSQLPPARHVEFKKGGWGAAIITTVGVALLWGFAWYVHAQTYRHPTDVMMRQVGEQPLEPGQQAAHGGDHGTAPAGEHGAAPAAGAAHGGAAPAGAAKAPAAH